MSASPGVSPDIKQPLTPTISSTKSIVMPSNGSTDGINEIKPDWALIDEISIPLLEQGIGSFDVLQRTLPTIVLSKFDKIDDEWTEARVTKLFRISQLQIRYILQSQQTLVKELEVEREKVKRATRTTASFRKSLMHTQRVTARDLFKCDECSKIFLHSTFLADHIQRKHRGSTPLISASGNSINNNNASSNGPSPSTPPMKHHQGISALGSPSVTWKA